MPYEVHTPVFDGPFDLLLHLVRRPERPYSRLQLLEQVRQTQEEIVVTKHGKPIARVGPYAPGSEELFGYMSGTVTVHGDIVSPTGEAWEADAD